jgi:hypothetical protein
MEENSFMASQDQDKAASALLRRSLGDSGEACPEPEILAAYFERSLDALETARYELHFSRCGRCRELLAAMDRAGELVHAGSEKTQKAARRAWLWDWRLLAPVTAVLVLAAVWTTARRTVPSQTAPLVAMSRSQDSAAPSVAPQYSPEPALRAPGEAAPAKPPTNFGQDSDYLAKASPALIQPVAPKAEKELGVNVPDNSQSEPRTDSVTKDSGAATSDSGGVTDKRANSSAAYGIAAPAAQPIQPSAPASVPAPPPPASTDAVAAGASPQANSVTVEAAVSSAKTAEAPARVQALVQQAGTQSPMQMRSLAVITGGTRSFKTLIPTPDTHILWRISGGASIERSIDGGATWQSQLLRSNVDMIAGSAPSAQVCWLAGSGGIIMLTKDAENWKKISSPAPTDFVAITARDASSATVTSADGRKFFTSDGGKHWNPAP